MLTVELVRSKVRGDSIFEVEIIGDRAGLGHLLLDLEHLCSCKPPEHFHFFSTEWGSGELSAEPHLVDSELVHHLRVTLLPD